MTGAVLGAESEAHLRGLCCGPRVGVNQQQRRSKMPAEITKPESKDQAKVFAKIKNYSSVLATQNKWTQILGWKKPADTWYDQVEDGATIDIQTIHVGTPTTENKFLVYFEGVPKKGKQKLRADVGTLPFKKP
jgi:hypothetical protein